MKPIRTASVRPALRRTTRPGARTGARRRGKLTASGMMTGLGGVGKVLVGMLSVPVCRILKYIAGNPD